MHVVNHDHKASTQTPLTAQPTKQAKPCLPSPSPTAPPSRPRTSLQPGLRQQVPQSLVPGYKALDEISRTLQGVGLVGSALAEGRHQFVEHVISPADDAAALLLAAYVVLALLVFVERFPRRLGLGLLAPAASVAEAVCLIVVYVVFVGLG